MSLREEFNKYEDFYRAAQKLAVDRANEILQSKDYYIKDKKKWSYSLFGLGLNTIDNGVLIFEFPIIKEYGPGSSEVLDEETFVLLEKDIRTVMATL